MAVTLKLAGLAGTALMAAAAIQAPEPSSPIEWWAIAGVAAGMMWRAGNWFSADHGFVWATFKSDMASLAALIVAALGFCHWLEIRNQTAGLVGLGAVGLGLDFFVTTARTAITGYARGRWGGDGK